MKKRKKRREVLTPERDERQLRILRELREHERRIGAEIEERRRKQAQQAL